MSLLPYLADALIIFVAVLASEFVLDEYRRRRKRRHMRHLNALSQRARAVARERAKERASAGGSRDSVETAT